MCSEVEEIREQFGPDTADLLRHLARDIVGMAGPRRGDELGGQVGRAGRAVRPSLSAARLPRDRKPLASALPMTPCYRGGCRNVQEACRPTAIRQTS